MGGASPGQRQVTLGVIRKRTVNTRRGASSYCNVICHVWLITLRTCPFLKQVEGKWMRAGDKAEENGGEGLGREDGGKLWLGWKNNNNLKIK